MKLSISNGNDKMGHIKSVSLPPVLTCNPKAPCFKECYARKICRIYPSVDKAYNNNFEILKTDRKFYFESVQNAIDDGLHVEKFFRWHVSGDIVDYDYFENMVTLANNNPITTFLAFTKQYSIVNEWIANNGSLPSNLKVIFSAWDDGNWHVENPYNLPMSHVIFEKDFIDVTGNWKLCGGNCSQCARSCNGCFGLNNGEHVAFYKH